MKPHIRVTAQNPSPMTLDGTNSYIVPSSDLCSVALIDPGPELDSHKRALENAVDCATLTAIVLTHHHADHSEMLGTAHEWAPGVPIYAVDEAFAKGAPALTSLPPEGHVVEFGSHESDRLTLIPTPGHTADSISVLHGNTLFSGDTILGEGTTVIMYPEGSVGQYLDSMQRISDLVDHTVETIEPAHGPTVENPRAVVDYYISHRNERLDQVIAAVERVGTIELDETDAISQDYAGRVADLVYADVPQKLRPAVLSSVSAQLEYLLEG